MTNIKTIFFTPLLACLLGLTFFQAVQTDASSGRASDQTDWQSKIDQELLDQIDNRGPNSRFEFIVRMNEQASLNVPAGLSKDERASYVFDQLTAHSAATQKEILAQVEKSSGTAKSYTIINALLVQGSGTLLTDLAQQTAVAHIHANPALRLDVQTESTYPFDQTRAPMAVEWGVEKIGAPVVWGKGITGTGVVIAGQDTGYNWEHPALQQKYRGWDGNTADHNYNWHDAISGEISGNSSNPCGYNLTIPCDDISSQHGTHTMGTMVGSDGLNEIGVAPGAEWIACRNMEEGYGTPDTYISCFDWFLAPTNINGVDPNPAKAPHVINNSWGCPTSEGCNTGNFDLMNTVIENLRTAGIVVVTSAGNSGSSCSSVNTPAAIFSGSFSVGATNISDDIASFSSRGPVTVDGSERMKPNVTAPGVSVRSAGSGSSYRSLSGTSMAGPHVAGAVGLMISAYPPIAGNIEAIETYLEQTAEFIGTGDCGGTEEFNNTYGHGRINVDHAIEAIWNIDITKQAPELIIMPNNGQLTTSGEFTYTISITKTGDMLTFTNAVLTDTLPAGTQFVRASQPVSQTTNGVTWDIGDLPPGSAQQLAVTVQVMGSTGTTETITLPAPSIAADYVPTKTGAEITSTIQYEGLDSMQFALSRDIPTSYADARVEIVSDTSLLLTYTISVSAPISIPTVTNATVTETLPISGTIVSTSQPVTNTADGFVWSIGSLTAAQSVSLDVVVQLPIGANGQNQLSSISFPATQITSDQTEPAESPPAILIPYNIWMPLMLESH